MKNTKDKLTAGEFCWNELKTPDTKKAQTFYSALLGWTTQDYPMGEMTYTTFMAGDKYIGGMRQISKEHSDQVLPNWMSYICVEDVEKVLEKAKTLGAEVKVPVTSVPDGRFGIIKDPTGAHIGFWQPA